MRVAPVAPFRHLVVPGGYTMSVAMTNCGRVGWVSDRTGYRYDPADPDTGAPWPRCRPHSSSSPTAPRPRRVSRLRSGRLPDQSLRGGRETQPASGSR